MSIGKFTVEQNRRWTNFTMLGICNLVGRVVLDTHIFAKHGLSANLKPRNMFIDGVLQSYMSIIYFVALTLWKGQSLVAIDTNMLPTSKNFPNSKPQNSSIGKYTFDFPNCPVFSNPGIELEVSGQEKYYNYCQSKNGLYKKA